MNINIVTKFKIGETVYWTDVKNGTVEICNGKITNIIIQNEVNRFVYYYEIDRPHYLFEEKNLHRSYEETLASWNEIRRGVIN